MECICENLTGGRGVGVTLWYASVTFWPGGSTWSSQICSHQNFLAGGVALFWSTYTHARQTR